MKSTALDAPDRKIQMSATEGAIAAIAISELESPSHEAELFGQHAVEIARYCFACDAAHDPGFWDYVCEDVSFIGPLPGMEEIFGKEEYRKAIGDDLNFWFDYLDEKYFLLYSDGRTAVVSGHLILKTREDEELFLFVKQRFTFFFVNVGGTPMVKHVHISDPDNIGRDETFPYQVGRELRDLIDEMTRNAVTDSMTGLKNRNFLEQNYDELSLELSGKKDGAGLVIYFDLNGFKQINDSLGHAAGDVLIRAFALSIGKAAREHLKFSYVLRAGGDEFVIIAPQDRLKVLLPLLRSIKQHLREFTDALKMPISFAAGFAVPNGRGLKELISIADHRMYRCKRRLKSAAVKLGRTAEIG